MILENFFPYKEPTLLTILSTYKCTAACKECCFESNPHLKTRLTLDQIKEIAKSALDEFRNIKCVVFSGGESFLLKDDLFYAIEYVRSLNESVNIRCVTNGFWGKNYERSKLICQRLKLSGLNEINISTGLDHQQYVPIDSIINCALSSIENNISTYITIESDSNESSCLNNFLFNKRSSKLLESNLFSYQVNSWMPFHKDAHKRQKNISKEQLKIGCNQVIDNMVITPYGKISSCCGLTFEHIPEMIIGKIEDNLRNIFLQQNDDFLKLWIRTEGPYSILKEVYGDHEEIAPVLDEIQHPCHACVLLYNMERNNKKILNEYLNIPNIKAIISKSLINSKLSNFKKESF